MPLFTCRSTSRSVGHTRKGVRQGPSGDTAERMRLAMNNHSRRSSRFIASLAGEIRFARGPAEITPIAGAAPVRIQVQIAYQRLETRGAPHVAQCRAPDHECPG